jgi:hypothetical protein
MIMMRAEKVMYMRQEYGGKKSMTNETKRL